MNQIIWLNGASSSGKTSISKVLQNILPDLYLHIQLDTFQEMLPTKYYMWCEEYWKLAIPLSTGFNRSIRTYYDSNINLIVDHVLVLDCWKEECSILFKDAKVFFLRLIAI